MILTRICSWLRCWASAGIRQRLTAGPVARITTIEDKRHYSGPPGGYREVYSPTLGLWEKRNTSSGCFDKIKKEGDVFKGVKREN